MSDPADKANQAPAASSISFTRSPEYRAIFSDIVRTRVGNGECAIIFSKATHVPGVNIATSVIEEQIEVIVTWAELKALSLTMASLVEGIEAEMGPLPIHSKLIEAKP